MSKADTMFKELGYEKDEQKSLGSEHLFIIYFKPCHTRIIFKTLIKSIEIGSSIDIQELQAINEKVKELGWNE